MTIPRDLPLRPNLLDLLIDDRPESPDTEVDTHQLIEEYRESVRRDLRDLLNTRRRCWSPFSVQHPALGRSLISYGLPDPTGHSFSSPVARRALRTQIERVIQSFLSPPLRRVTVEVPGVQRETDRVLRFRVSATLVVEEYEEALVFESSLEPLSASFDVSNLRH